MVWTGSQLLVWGGLKDFKPGAQDKYVSRKSKGFKVTLEDDRRTRLPEEQAIEVQLSH